MSANVATTVTIAVTGATGFVGQAVLDEAVRRGLLVRALTRRAQEPRDGVTWVRGDLADHGALRALAVGSDAVLHIAGVVNAPDAAGFQAGNVAGTQAILDAAGALGEKRFICVSSLAAREPDLSDYGRSKHAAEELVRASRLDWTIIRPPAIYGPRDAELLELFKAARFHVLPMPPAGRASIIHVDDLARLLLDLVPSGERVSGQIFEPDDGRIDGWAHGALASAIGDAMGRRVWSPAMPKGLLMGAARLDRMLRRGKAKLTPDRASYMSHPDWVSTPDRSVPRDVWQPEIPTVQGLASTAQWYREAGWL